MLLEEGIHLNMDTEWYMQIGEHFDRIVFRHFELDFFRLIKWIENNFGCFFSQS
jgi:hypothetical protein